MVSRRAAQAALVCFFAVTLVVVVGYATFGRHPERIPQLAGSSAAYGLAMRLLPALQIGAAAITLAIALTAWTRWRWLSAFFVLYGLSLASELLGTGTGVPFGAYHYSPLLGPAWSGRVPIVIPLSWFTMAMPSFAIAKAMSGRVTGPRVALMAALWLVLWDLSLDPAMSHATAYWGWASAGAYFGMPLSNLLGWFVTALALMVALWLLGVQHWIGNVPVGWMAAYYAVVLLLPLGMCVAAGLWVPVAITLLGGAIFLAGGPWRARVSTVVARPREQHATDRRPAAKGVT